MNIILLLILLQIKHFIADFCLQFSYMIEEKGTYWAPGGLHHALVHTVGTFLVLFMLSNINLAIWLALLDGIIHYHVDWAKMNMSKKYTPSDASFWTWLGLDQALHQLTYILIVAIIIL
jgi:hypothetical protein